MNEQEITRLVVRLIGDPSSFVSMTKKAADEVKNVSDKVNHSAKQIEHLSHNVRSFSQAAVGALGMFGAATTLQSAFEKFSAFERGQISLAALLTANGRDVDGLTKQYLAYADGVTAVTLATKGEVMGLLKQAEQMQVTGEKAENLVTAAYALAEGDSDLAGGFVKSLAAMERGNTAMIRRQLKLNDVKDSTELLDRIQRRANAGLDAAQKTMDTTWGHVEKLKRSMGGLSKDVGELVADGIRPLIDGLQRTLNWFKSLSPETRKLTVYVSLALMALAGLGPILTLVAPLFKPLVAAFGLIKAALLAVLSPVGLIIVAVGALTYAWVKFTEEGRGALDDFLRGWERLKDLVAPVIQGVKDAIAAGDFTGAFKLAWLGVKLVFKEVTADLRSDWEGMVFGFRVAWTDFATDFQRGLRAIPGDFMLGLIELSRLGGFFTDEEAHNRTGQVIKEGLAKQRVFEEAAKAANDAAKQAAVKDTEDSLKAVRDEIEQVKAEITKATQDAAFKRAWHDFFHPGGAAGIKPKINLGDIPKKVIPVHAMLKFEGAATGSAEAITRMAEYREFGVIGGSGGKDNAKQQVGLLGQIAKNTDPKNQKPAVVLEDADLEEP